MNPSALLSRCARCLAVMALLAFGLTLNATTAGAESFVPIVIEGPIPFDDPSGPPNEPGGGHTPAEVGVAEEEFFFSGSVDVYTYDENNLHLGKKVIKAEDQPYKTRMLVRRPFKARKFNGTVVIESMNSTAGFDGTPSWLPSAEYFAREGIVYIGVTTSGNQALPFLQNGCGGLAPSCGTRYSSLFMSDNGQEYEMLNQLVTALKTNGGPLPKRFGRVERVFLTGQSQQGGSVITHANEFHIPYIDGYFFMGASRSRSISSGAPSLPAEERFVRTDLPVPVYRGSSEGDVGDGSSRQEDTDTSRYASFRLVEVPGTSHNPIHKSDVLGFPLSFFCVNEPFSLADGPIFGSHVWNAMWENMRRQSDKGIRPPYAPRIEIVDGVIQRDEFMNARGGVRLPEIDVPTNSYFSPNNTGKRLCDADDPEIPAPPGCIPSTGNPATDGVLQFVAGLACRLNGSLAPLSEETLDELYPSHGRYVREIVRRTNKLVRNRFLLRDDARSHKRAAAQSDIGR